MNLFNTYRVLGKIGYIKTNYKGVEYEIIVDRDIVDELSKSHWMLNSDGYVFTNLTKNNKRKQLFLHHVVIDRKNGCETDHINQNKLDNRAINLRTISRTKNLWNLPKRKDNTLGQTGVRWYPKIKKFASSIQVNKKRIHLGVFINKEDAIRSYLLAKEKYHKI